jgi:hypothetical protein
MNTYKNSICFRFVLSKTSINLTKFIDNIPRSIKPNWLHQDNNEIYMFIIYLFSIIIDVDIFFYKYFFRNTNTSTYAHTHAHSPI